MKGEIIISAAEMPEGLPEEAVVLAFNIHGDAEMSVVERIAVMFQLGIALSYTDEDWEMLMHMVRNEPPFDGLMNMGYQIGGTWEDDDEEDD